MGAAEYASSLFDVPSVAASPAIPIAIIAFFFSFGPVALLAAILLFRAGRYIRGFLYGATGTFFQLQAPRCLRFSSARLMLEDAEELHWGISYCQILEEVVTNSIIGVLREYGIDTHAVRQEMSSFVNQGVYMTGGSLMAENLAVGVLAKIKNRTYMRQARMGKKTLKASAAKAA
jgi:hypothetical protein